MAAIFDLPLTPMSDSVQTSTSELQDPENVGVALIYRCCLVNKYLTGDCVQYRDGNKNLTNIVEI